MSQDRLGTSDIDGALGARLANSGFESICLTDLESSTFVWVNDAFCKTVGMPREQLLGHSDDEFGFYSDPQVRADIAEALRDTGRYGPKVGRFTLPDGSESYAEVKCELVEFEGRLHVIVATRLITEQVDALRMLQRRDAILLAAAFAAQRFLGSGTFQEQMTDVLQRLGQATRSDRCFAYRNGTLPDGRVTMSIVNEWRTEGLPSMLDDPENHDYPYDEGFTRWLETLEKGEAIASTGADLPRSEKGIIGVRDTSSIVAVPVRATDSVWGFIGIFREADAEPVSEAEIEAIKAVAGSVGAALGRLEAESRAREAELTFQTLVEALPGAVYLEGLTPGTKKTSYLSPYYSEMYGVQIGEGEVLSLDLWRRVVHPDDLEMVLAESARTDETGEPYALEYRVTPPGKEMMWVSDRAVLVRNEEGEPQFWLGITLDITQRVRAEQDLRAAEERLRQLIEQVPVAIYTQALSLDPAQSFLSPQILGITGHAPDDFRDGDLWTSLIHPDDLEDVMVMEAETDASGAPFRMDYRVRHKDGYWVWVRDEALLFQQKEGEPLWQGSLTDITEEKTAEEALRATAIRLRSLIEQIPFATYVHSPRDEDGFYVSPQIEQVTGYPHDRFTEIDFWDSLILEEDLPFVRAESDRTDDSGEVFDMEYRIRDSDGGVRWIHEVTVRVEQEDQGRGTWQGVFEDITRRKAAEARLREAEERYRNLVELAPAITYQERVSEGEYPASVMFYMSPQVVEMLGYDGSALQEDPTLFWNNVVHPDDRDEVVEGSTEVTRTREPYRGEYRVVRADGTVMWVRDEATLVRTDEDGTQFWHGFITDITDRKRAEAELERALHLEREAVQRLQALDELKNTFLNAVSHDLRTPLAAIHGLALTLERDDLELERHEARDLARRIAANSRKLDRLVTDLLDLDRLSRGIVEANLATTDLSLVIRKVVSEAEFLEATRVIIDAENIMLAIDQPKVERIVENLLANTVRHTPPGTNVWVRLLRETGGVILAVEDDGPGIPPDMREAVFEAFRQGESPSRHSPGAGVGLSLVSAFAELHGGRAWVEDRSGGGASFRVFLPFPPR